MLLQSEVSDYQVYPGLSEPAASSPSGAQRRARSSACIALQLGNEELYRVFSDYDGLGETGETLVATREGRRAGLRGAAAARPRGARSAGTVRMGGRQRRAMQRAVKGERGYGDGDRLSRRPGHGRLVLRPRFPLGLGGQAGPRRSLRDDRPAAAGERPAPDRSRSPRSAWVAWPVARSITRPIREAALVGRPRGRGRPDRRRRRQGARARPACCSRRSTR